ncbi:YciI family protein [Terasakiella pusilla]|uniref:YciI family protein n=1 Tax=Terasakiella pusilla TaxID=64973 RepID=UPI00048B5547|nr:YciI family protein [Terasakiella pusilla]
MQFLIIAKDGTDPDALNRRLAARPAHFERARKAKKDGELLIGGAILDDHNQMIGSSLYVEVEDRAALDKWLADDPYTKGNVWQDFEIHVMKVADLD